MLYIIKVISDGCPCLEKSQSSSPFVDMDNTTPLPNKVGFILIAYLYVFYFRICSKIDLVILKNRSVEICSVEPGLFESWLL